MNITTLLRKFLIIVLIFPPFMVNGHDKIPLNRMDYHLSWDGNSSVLKIDLFYNATAKDSTVFTYGIPEAGGQPHIFDILGKITVGADDSLLIRAKDRGVVVYHNSDGLKKLHFEIDGQLVINPKRALANEAFRPTIAPGFLYTLGYQLFMSVSENKYTDIGIVWDSWPKEMPYLASTNPEAKPGDIQFIKANDTEKNSFMLQMSKDLVIKKYIIKGIPNYLLTSKSDSTSGLPKDITSLMTGFIPQVRDFWQDYKAPFYILSAIPLRNDVESTMTGMGLLNGLSIRYKGPLDIEKVQLISHEISHNWIGVRLKYKSIGMENNWFNEGFNDYIAIYNLNRAGLFDKKAFLNHMNKHNFKAHYTSPVGTIAGDSIEPNFFKSRLYEKIPYQRGLIYAFYLDNQIRLATGRKHTIRHFLTSLYARNLKDQGRPITIEDFTKCLSDFLPGKDIVTEINNYMLGGELIDFNNVKLIDDFRIIDVDHVPVLSLSKKADLKKIYN